MSYLEDIYNNPLEQFAGFQEFQTQNFIDNNKNLDINMIKHKLYRSYDDNKALRVARENTKKVAPIQESNCKRVLVFDEYSCDSTKHINDYNRRQNDQEYTEQHLNESNDSVKMNMHLYHPVENLAQLETSPAYNEKFKKNLYSNSALKQKDNEIYMLRHDVEIQKEVMKEKQENEICMSKKIMNLEKEFQDFKTNVSNYLLSYKSDLEDNTVGDFHKKNKAQENENYNNSQTNFNESSHQFSSQDTIKPNNIFMNLVLKKSNQKSIHEHQNTNQFNNELMMLKSNSSNTQNMQGFVPQQQYNDEDFRSMTPEVDVEHASHDSCKNESYTDDTLELKNENQELKNEIIRQSNTINSIISKKDWKKKSPEIQPKKRNNKSFSLNNFNYIYDTNKENSNTLNDPEFQQKLLMQKRQEKLQKLKQQQFIEWQKQQQNKLEELYDRRQEVIPKQKKTNNAKVNHVEDHHNFETNQNFANNINPNSHSNLIMNNLRASDQQLYHQQRLMYHNSKVNNRLTYDFDNLYKSMDGRNSIDLDQNSERLQLQNFTKNYKNLRNEQDIKQSQKESPTINEFKLNSFSKRKNPAQQSMNQSLPNNLNLRNNLNKNHSKKNSNPIENIFSGRTNTESGQQNMNTNQNYRNFLERKKNMSITVVDDIFNSFENNYNANVLDVNGIKIRQKQLDLQKKLYNNFIKGKDNLNIQNMEEAKNYQIASSGLNSVRNTYDTTANNNIMNKTNVFIQKMNEQNDELEKFKHSVNIINEEESNFSNDNSKTLTNTNGDKTDRMNILMEKRDKIDLSKLISKKIVGKNHKKSTSYTLPNYFEMNNSFLNYMSEKEMDNKKN